MMGRVDKRQGLLLIASSGVVVVLGAAVAVAVALRGEDVHKAGAKGGPGAAAPATGEPLPGDRAYVVTVRDLAGLLPPGVAEERERLRRVRAIEGEDELEYTCDDLDGSGVFFMCVVTRVEAKWEAPLALRDWTLAWIGPTTRPWAERPAVGADEAWGGTALDADGNPNGAVFACRRGRHVFAFACEGAPVERDALLERLRPWLERFDRWEP